MRTLQLWLLMARAGGCWHCLALHPPDLMAAPHTPQAQKPCQMTQRLSEVELHDDMDWLWKKLLSKDLCL